MYYPSISVLQPIANFVYTVVLHCHQEKLGNHVRAGMQCWAVLFLGVLACLLLELEVVTAKKFVITPHLRADNIHRELNKHADAHTFILFYSGKPEENVDGYQWQEDVRVFDSIYRHYVQNLDVKFFTFDATSDPADAVRCYCLKSGLEFNQSTPSIRFFNSLNHVLQTYLAVSPLVYPTLPSFLGYSTPLLTWISPPCYSEGGSYSYSWDYRYRSSNYSPSV